MLNPASQPSLPPGPQSLMPQGQPAQQPMMQQHQEPWMTDTEEGDGTDIVQGLEQHLSTIPDEQKQFLISALETNPEQIITVLGIVNGQETFEYFKSIYDQLSPAPQQNSAEPQPNVPEQALNPSM